MLSKQRRIDRGDFPYILKQGKRYSSPHLLLYVSQINSKNSSNQSQFSFSVSKKVAKLATERNKLRRKGYNVIFLHLNSIRTGFYCFFSFKKSVSNFTILEKEILELLKASFVLS